MKTTLSTTQAANILIKDDNANWSYRGAIALIEYLEELEEDMGEEIGMDFVALRCDYSEYKSLEDWAEGYWGATTNWMHEIKIDDDADADEIDEAIREHIQDNGQLIEFTGGVIVSSF